jgi:hypothetical protein
MDRRGADRQSDDIVLEALEGASATPWCAVGSLSANRDLEPETGGDDDYAEVGRKRASMKWAD